jgi:hypothetical protein
MPDVTIKRIDEFDTPNGGGFCRARATLGVSAFGMQVESFGTPGAAYQAPPFTELGASLPG